MKELGILNQFDTGGVGVKYRQSSRTTSQGFPILGGPKSPNTTQDEYENIPLLLNVKVKIFDLSLPEELKEYTEVRDLIANRACVQLDRTKLISDDGKKISVHMEWADIQGKMLPSK
jgi:hypothetical protein